MKASICLVNSRCCFAEHGRKCYKKLAARLSFPHLNNHITSIAGHVISQNSELLIKPLRNLNVINNARVMF